MSFTLPATELSKRQLRQLLRARRRSLSLADQCRAARQLAQRAQRQPWFVRARSVALYIAADGEIDPRFLIDSAWLRGKQVYLPRLLVGNRLEFARYRRGMRLRRNRFGIPEPLPGTKKASPLALDVVLLPLVAFDANGNRLGMGGGFYDRTLARLAARANAPQLIGLAHGFQQVDSLTRETWDIPLSGVLTERGWTKAVR